MTRSRPTKRPCPAHTSTATHIPPQSKPSYRHIRRGRRPSLTAFAGIKRREFAMRRPTREMRSNRRALTTNRPPEGNRVGRSLMTGKDIAIVAQASNTFIEDKARRARDVGMRPEVIAALADVVAERVAGLHAVGRREDQAPARATSSPSPPVTPPCSSCSSQRRPTRPPGSRQPRLTRALAHARGAPRAATATSSCRCGHNYLSGSTPRPAGVSMPAYPP